MEKNNNMRKVIMILLALVIVSAIGTSYASKVFASDSSRELEENL